MDADLPHMSYEDPAPDQLVILYRSKRKLCRAAEGLIDGVSEHFKTPFKLEHTKCMHRGDDHCRLELTFGEPQVTEARALVASA